MFKNEGLVLLEELVTIFEFILIRLDKECLGGCSHSFLLEVTMLMC